MTHITVSVLLEIQPAGLTPQQAVAHAIQVVSVALESHSKRLPINHREPRILSWAVPTASPVPNS